MGYDKDFEACKQKKRNPATLASVVIDNFVKQGALKTIAAVADTAGHSKKGISSSLSRVGCLITHGSAFLIGCFLAAWRSMFSSGRFNAIAIFSKMKYDETPLKMKITEFNNFISGTNPGSSVSSKSLEEDYMFAKILRIEWDLSFLVTDPRGKYQLISLKIPLPLASVERNTAECMVAVFDRATNLVPELQAFMSEFTTQIRIPVMDRFKANFRVEKHLKSWMHPTSSIAVEFTCDVHKEASCCKAAFALGEDTLSGVVNLALALGHAGSAGSLRTCLQTIFEESLIISHSDPPGEDSQEHKHHQAVLDCYLPVEGKGRQAKMRRYIIQSLANSDIQSSDIVHHCRFGCCKDSETTLFNFKHHLVQALLPHKLKVLNRKSWTGASEAIAWVGLLQSHWHLLPRVIMKYLNIDRPISNLEEQDESETGLFLPLMSLFSAEGMGGRLTGDWEFNKLAEECCSKR